MGTSWSRLVRLAREESGSELVEVAMVLPVYFMTVFVIISFTCVLFAYENAMLATKMGVRYASLHSNTSLVPCTAASVSSLVTPMLMSPMATSVTVSTAWGGSGNVVGGTVTVSVRLTYGILPWGILNNFAATASTQSIIAH